MILHIDIETYSSVDLRKYGMYKYVEAPDFEILLFAYAFDDEPVHLVDLTAAEQIPGKVLRALADEKAVKMAHNAAFEITCLGKKFYSIHANQWRCTAVQAAEAGLPRGLGELSTVLKMPKDIGKMSKGRALINYFCKPCKPTKVNGKRTRNLPEHDPERWEEFKEYCKQDVRAEREVDKKLHHFRIVDSEQEYWLMDQRINNRGALVDMEFVRQAEAAGAELKAELLEEAKEITGLENPNSVKQLVKWLDEEIEEEQIESLTKSDVKRILKLPNEDHVDRVLEIRQEVGKTSVTKYTALLGAACADERIRGTLLFYGAQRTGRWAGRIFQPQNLPRNYLTDLEDARRIVKYGGVEALKTFYDKPFDILSQLIRTSIIPRPGYKFIISDYSAVEARALAWLAGEEWRLKVFRGDGKIYEASASAAFNIPMDKITKELRQQGKVLELACGYGGSVGAIGAMDYSNAIPTEDRKRLVKAWREASPKITELWWDMDAAAVKAVNNPNEEFKVRDNISFIREKGLLFMILPSGRRLAYPRPMMMPDEKFGGTKITFEGTDQYRKKWTRIDTYGPKLVENLVQAFCRDLLCYGMHELEKEGYDVVLHVHDEGILEVPMDVKVETINEIIARKPEWAGDMPHAADGFESMFYMKEMD